MDLTCPGSGILREMVGFHDLSFWFSRLSPSFTRGGNIRLRVEVNVGWTSLTAEVKGLGTHCCQLARSMTGSGSLHRRPPGHPGFYPSVG